MFLAATFGWTGERCCLRKGQAKKVSTVKQRCVWIIEPVRNKELDCHANDPLTVNWLVVMRCVGRVDRSLAGLPANVRH